MCLPFGHKKSAYQLVRRLKEMNSRFATRWTTIGSMKNEEDSPVQEDDADQEPKLLLADEGYTCVMRPPGTFGTDPNESD